MKRALLRVATASVLVLGMIGAASAADLIVKAPIVAPVPVFSWTGVYIGIGGGSGWGTKEYSWNQDATVAALNQQGYPFFPPPLGSFGNTQSSHAINGGSRPTSHIAGPRARSSLWSRVRAIGMRHSRP